MDAVYFMSSYSIVLEVKVFVLNTVYGFTFTFLNQSDDNIISFIILYVKK